MDKDKAKGKGQQAKGSVKESWGKMTGQKATEAKGKAERAGGKVREEYGKGKEHAKSIKDEAQRRTRGA